MIQIFEHEKILAYFEQFPSASLTVYCPGSGSWCETFDNQDHYFRRTKAYIEWTSYTATLPTYRYDDEARRLMKVYMENEGHHSNPWDHGKEYASNYTGSAKAPPSWNGTENLVQNFCVTFSHNFNHQYSRIKNTFVVKGAPLTKETALKIVEILFPKYTDIIIESIENDVLTLTPSEYHFMQGILKDKLRAQRDRSNYVETEYDKYLLMLVEKMEARMDQFPVYHT